MAQYRSASTSIIKRHTKKFTPDDAYTDHYFFLSVLEMLRQKYIQKKKKERQRESSANPDTQNIPAICCSTEVQHGRAHSQRS